MRTRVKRTVKTLREHCKEPTPEIEEAICRQTAVRLMATDDLDRNQRLTRNEALIGIQPSSDQGFDLEELVQAFRKLRSQQVLGTKATARIEKE